MSHSRDCKQWHQHPPSSFGSSLGKLICMMHLQRRACHIKLGCFVGFARHMLYCIHMTGMLPQSFRCWITLKSISEMHLTGDAVPVKLVLKDCMVVMQEGHTPLQSCDYTKSEVCKVFVETLDQGMLHACIAIFHCCPSLPLSSLIPEWVAPACSFLSTLLAGSWAM